jgi:hypothetical protein
MRILGGVEGKGNRLTGHHEQQEVMESKRGHKSAAMAL